MTDRAPGWPPGVMVSAPSSGAGKTTVFNCVTGFKLNSRRCYLLNLRLCNDMNTLFFQMCFQIFTYFFNFSQQDIISYFNDRHVYA